MLGSLISGLVGEFVSNRYTLYSNEDAFDMMDTFREKAGPDANLQLMRVNLEVEQHSHN